MAAFLLDHGADIDARDVDHESTPAQYLVRGRPDVARYLVSRGCSTDILLGAALGDTAVVARHLAANPAAVRTSVDATWFPMKNLHAGGSIYIWTLGGRKTAHTIAREFGHADVEQLLWKASDDSLSLTMACELGDDDLVRSLITARPEIVRALQPADVTRIVAAAELRNGDAVKRMLAIGWPAGTVDRGGLTALHWAGFHGDAATARALLAAGAPLDVRDDVHSGNAARLGALGISARMASPSTATTSGTVQAMLDAGATPPEVTDTLVASDEVKRVLAQHRSRKATISRFGTDFLCATEAARPTSRICGIGESVVLFRSRHSSRRSRPTSCARLRRSGRTRSIARRAGRRRGWPAGAEIPSRAATRRTSRRRRLRSTRPTQASAGRSSVCLKYPPPASTNGTPFPPANPIDVRRTTASPPIDIIDRACVAVVSGALSASPVMCVSSVCRDPREGAFDRERSCERDAKPRLRPDARAERRRRAEQREVRVAGVVAGQRGLPCAEVDAAGEQDRAGELDARRRTARARRTS